MINTLKLNYYWEVMFNDIIHYFKTCQACERRKRPIKPIKSPLEPIHVLRAIQILCIDTLGPLNITDSGNRHIVVNTDLFTRWPIAILVKEVNTN